ncbi:alpha/beta hydrolase [Sporolactobacillus shoreicorticis]|uniref:RBBP9/YdeN family alpha/beta hydrolase n=1 Tax=Sporolactobacillus shoreicorticis TaxID=1923877 RepID=A0ABW5RYH5_9BACL|nr:alpha/beta hydrolase [Sporolactobacillus shoreicorticis]MCO7125170.1 alpha/beta hydrolase [Sporolactobacillus shoreicorticis]
MGKQIYIIHGYGAQPTNHWFPWLKEKLKADGHQVLIPHMPNSSSPDKEEWLEALVNEIKNLDSNTYFVAHSLGCITLLKYLEKLDPLPSFGGFILVSGFSAPLPSLPSISPFTAKKVDGSKIISATNSRAVIAAKDDYIVPFQFSQDLSEQLNASFYLVEKGGHFLKNDGFITFPLVFDLLNNIIKKSGS